MLNKIGKPSIEFKRVEEIEACQRLHAPFLEWVSSYPPLLGRTAKTAFQRVVPEETIPVPLPPRSR